jgi:hypothetical protein
MKFRIRRQVRLGPIRLNFTQRGFSSWGLGLGRWSWNAKTDKHTFDTPGPGYFQSKGRRSPKGNAR